MQEFSLIYLGERFHPISQDLPSAIIDSYTRRNKPLHAAVASINFLQADPIPTIGSLLEQWRSLALDSRRLIRDDLQFVATLFDKLLDEQRLPGIACIRTLDFLADDVVRNAADSRHLDAISGSISMNLCSILEHLDAEWRELREWPPDTRCSIHLTYVVQPSVNLSVALGAVQRELGFSEAGEIHVVETGSGSYYEILAGTIASVYALRVLFALANGILDEIVVMRGKARLLARTRIPTRYRDVVLAPYRKRGDSPLAHLPKVVELIRELLGNSGAHGLEQSNVSECQVTVHDEEAGG